MSEPSGTDTAELAVHVLQGVDVGFECLCGF